MKYSMNKMNEKFLSIQFYSAKANNYACFKHSHTCPCRTDNT